MPIRRFRKRETQSNATTGGRIYTAIQNKFKISYEMMFGVAFVFLIGMFYFYSYPNDISSQDLSVQDVFSIDSPVLDYTIMVHFHSSRVWDFKTFFNVSWAMFGNGAHVTFILDANDKEQQGFESLYIPYDHSVFYVKRVFKEQHPTNNFPHLHKRMFADQYTDKEYIGYVDTDGLFTTFVNERSMFRNGKPLIIAETNHEYTKEGYNYWGYLAPFCIHTIMKRPEAIKCMSQFPTMIKAKHLKLLRDHIEKLHSKDFEDAVKDMVVECGFFPEFSMMCNYIWYHHRDEYEWSIRDYDPYDENLKTLKRSNTISLKESSKIIELYSKPEVRIAIDGTHNIPFLEGKAWSEHDRNMKRVNMTKIWANGLCYAGVLDNGCDKNRAWDILFRFDDHPYRPWSWDSRCIDVQKEYFQNLELSEKRKQKAIQIYNSELKTLQKLRK